MLVEKIIVIKISRTKRLFLPTGIEVNGEV